MFGLCAFARNLFVIIAVFFVAVVSHAQAQKGTVVNEEAFVYSLPDFDSPVVGAVKIGEVYDISTGKKEAFFKIRLKPGTVAWIADNDIRPGIVQSLVDARENAKNKQNKKSAKGEDKKKKRPKKAFAKTRFRGPVVEMLQFKESTLGGRQTDNLLMYGIKLAGPNVVIAGDIDTEANFLFHMGAPKYYADKTGNSANGWMFMANFLFENVTVASPGYNYYFGFGPMVKYSHFELGLTSAGKTKSYSADDIAIGAIFNFGVAFQLSDYALRLDAKYYWEKESYIAGGLSFLFPF